MSYANACANIVAIVAGYLLWKVSRFFFRLMQSFYPDYTIILSTSCTTGCPPVRGDNPRALASGLSYVQVDKHGIIILYHLHQCRPCTSSDSPC